MAGVEELAASTIKSLHEIWNEVGLSSDETAAIEAKLQDDVKALYASYVEQQEQNKQALINETDASKATITQLAQSLLVGQDIVRRAKFRRQMTLLPAKQNG